MLGVSEVPHLPYCRTLGQDFRMLLFLLPPAWLGRTSIEWDIPDHQLSFLLLEVQSCRFGGKLGAPDFGGWTLSYLLLRPFSNCRSGRSA